MSDSIAAISAREILDSRGNPTLEVSVRTSGGSVGVFATPSGASTGTHEARELRDGGVRYAGLGVQGAVKNVIELIAPALTGLAVGSQNVIDERMRDIDGTEDKSKLGGNAMVGVSIAVAKAAAQSEGIEMHEYIRSLSHAPVVKNPPLLFMNLVNGGKHAEGSTQVQEFHVVPMTNSVSDAIEVGVRLQSALRRSIRNAFGALSTNIGDEGGFVPAASSHEDVLALMTEAITEVASSFPIRISLDVAASSFYQDGTYMLDGVSYTPPSLLEHYKTLVGQYSILSIEDPFHEEDFDSFAKLKAEGSVAVVGDDLTVTSAARLTRAIESRSVDSVIIKPNQIGTLSETLETIECARKSNIACIVSHRSGETNDSFIVDLAVGAGAYGIKAGAPQRGERIAKYNRLLELASWYHA